MAQKRVLKKACAATLAAAVLCSGLTMTASANYTSSWKHTGVGTDYGKPVWSTGNKYVSESVDFSSTTVENMMQAIKNFDFDQFKKDNSNLPWLDKLLVNEGVIPDDVAGDSGANTLFSRGSALYMKSQEAAELGFVGEPYYADTLNQSSMYSVSLSTGAAAENADLRKNYPSHENQTFTSGDLKINQKKFITYGNSAVTLYEFTNPTASDISFTVTVKSPFVTAAQNDELVGYRVAAPIMVGTSGQDVVQAMSYVDVHLCGDGMTAKGTSLEKTITVPAGKTVSQKIIMGWLADEIPQSLTDYNAFKGYATNDEAFSAQVTAYNSWWADNIPYIDIPDENVKKVLYYRWWCNRFNILDANIPGNDWQFPMNMEGVLGYNNGITVSVPWAMQDLKWLRDPTYVYGTWLAQGEYSENSNYKNNPGRPNTWTWDMMQNTSQVGWEAYKIHGGGSEILSKFAGISANDVTGTLNTFKPGSSAAYNNQYLVFYNHAPMTGNDGDTVSMHWNGGGSYARLDGSSTNYANALATAQMYAELGNASKSEEMSTLASNIQNAVLTDLWYDSSDFDGDGKADTNGTGSFLHKQASSNKYVPWRDNNMFVFNFGVVPNANQAGYQSKYLSQLKDYADPNYYPIFPFFTADQNSILKRVAAFVNGSVDAYGTDQLAWCNFGNYINTVRASLRYYPVSNINTNVYQTLFDWGAWLHTVEAGNTDHLDSNEFFWLTNYYFGTTWTKDNPPQVNGNLVRSWIHHDTLGMMDYTVFEDIAGIQARTDNKIELWPVGVDYDYFAVDNIKYHDSDISVVWQNPAKYTDANPHYAGIPVGFTLYVNGERVMTTNEMSHVIYDTATGKAELPTGDVEGAVGSNKNTKILYEKGSASALAAAKETSLKSNAKAVDMFNKAGVDIVNDGENLAAAQETTITSTYISNDSGIKNLADGSTIASQDQTSNTALFKGTPNASDSIDFDFGSAKKVDNVKIYFYNDRLIDGYSTPQSYSVQYWDEASGTYKPVTGQYRYPDTIASNYNNLEFTAVQTSKIRVTVTHNLNFSTGIKEIQIYNNNLTVIPSVNKAPKVTVDSNIGVEVGSALTVTPVITDDGLPTGTLTYKWEKVSGPDGVVMEDGADTKAALKATFNTVGKYKYKLTVSDGEKATTVDIPISVYVATSGLKDLMKPFEALSADVSRNSADFSTNSWEMLQEELAAAQKLLDSGGYTAQQIKNETDKLQLAINSLEYVNVGLLAKATTSYVSSWETLSAVNDGYKPTTSANTSHQYGNWGSGKTSHWVEYTWDKEVKANGSDIFFFDDGGGVQVPKSYKLEYWDSASNAYKEVTNMSKQTLEKDKFNTVTFDEVTTTKFRITMENQSASAYTGIKQWRVLGAVGDTPEPEKVIQSVTPCSVDTTVNVVPTLPSKVMVIYEDGTKGLAAVTWNQIPADKLSVATSFTVLGKVQGTELSASCTINVKYDKSALKALIDSSNKILNSKANYSATDAQWNELTSAVQAAQQVYDNSGATEGDIKNATDRLTAAKGAVNISNYAAAAAATASYTASWNTVAAVNDGLVSQSSGTCPNNDGKLVYGNWGSNSGLTSEWVQYTWDQAVTLKSSSVFFYDNRSSDSSYKGEGLDVWGGVAVPISYYYESLDDNGAWVKIQVQDGLNNSLDRFNATNFAQPVTTKAIRIQMNRNKLATGIIEWKVGSENVTPDPVDKTVLQTAISTASQKEESDYTAESYAALKQALEEARKVANNANATQSEVNQAAQALQAAITGLVIKPDEDAVKAQAVANLVSALPDAGSVTKEHADAVSKAYQAYFGLTEKQKGLLDSTLATKLTDDVAALRALTQVNSTLDASITAQDGTYLDPAAELRITAVPEQQIDINKINSNIAQLVSGKKLVQMFDISLIKNGSAVQPDGKVTIRVKLTDTMLFTFTDFQMVYVSDTGEVTPLSTKVENGYLFFETTHFSNYAIIGTAKNTESSSSSDVSDSSSPVPSSDVSEGSQGDDTTAAQTGDSGWMLGGIVLLFGLSAAVVTVLKKNRNN